MSERSRDLADRGPAPVGILPMAVWPVLESEGSDPAGIGLMAAAGLLAFGVIGWRGLRLAQWIRSKRGAPAVEADEGRSETAEPCCCRYPRCLCECYLPKAARRPRRGRAW